MKKIIILLTITFIASIISFNAFAVPQGTEQMGNTENKGAENKALHKKYPEKPEHKSKGSDKSNIEDHSGHIKHECEKCHKDPLERLESIKGKVSQDLKDGKISQEKADELNKKIDERIAKIKQFNSLSLPEKKQQLSEKFKSRMEEAVKEGRITKDEGGKLQAEFEKQLESWDGSKPIKPIHKLRRHVE